MTATAAPGGNRSGFDSSDPGTSESDWLQRGLARLPTIGSLPPHLVVLAAHPDDETLGAGGLIATAAAAGVRVTVVVCTDGSRSHPRSPTTVPGRLATLRRAELRSALDRLAPAARVQLLGLPDGELAAHADELSTVLDDLVEAGDLVVAPWRLDRHPDHEAAGTVAQAAAERVGAACWQYPIWAWHWAAPGSAELPWRELRRFELADRAVRAKAAAMDAHRSQHRALSDLPGDEALLSAEFLAHFRRPFEIFLDARPPAHSLPATFFQQFYRDSPGDPWGFVTRWYEARKRAVLLAALPRERFRSAFEPGCSVGVLTVELATRCDRVLATDVVPAAVAAARGRVAGGAAGGSVTVQIGSVPADWPPGEFDLIVLSEVGYYCGTDDLARLCGLAAAALTADGVLVACHWRHPVAEYPVSGDEVHRVLRRQPGLARLVHHAEEDFVLEVFTRPPAVSVARTTGLLG